MDTQPPAHGGNVAQQMLSRAEERTEQKLPTPYSRALCAKVRAAALKKQREALGALAAAISRTSAADHDNAS